MTETPSAPTVTSADRWVGALIHLGVPFMGPFLPLGLGAMSEQPFRKAHARQALTFQLGFLGFWSIVVVLTILLVVPYTVMPAVLAIALLAELPQIIRALSGQPPFQLARDSWRGGPFRLIE